MQRAAPAPVREESHYCPRACWPGCAALLPCWRAVETFRYRQPAPPAFDSRLQRWRALDRQAPLSGVSRTAGERIFDDGIRAGGRHSGSRDWPNPFGQDSGIPVPRQQLKGNAYYIRRFDRGPNGKRIHIEDFNQLYEQFPEAKYKNYSYTNMATDLWRLTDEVQFAEFVRRLIFNAGIGNNDMHLKNWSLMYPDRRTPQLAPAYDFVSTVHYIADDRLALSIAKEKAPAN
ncbi:MAG: HipA domain-containing protein [Edaphobacter sp.]